MCHLKSRNVCHRHKETNSLPLIEFQPGFQLFLFVFFFFYFSWQQQKMCHLGSPANKRCVILKAGMFATVTKKQLVFRWLSFNQGFNSSFFFSFLFCFFLKLHCYEKWEDYLWPRLITYFAKSCFPTKGRCFELFKYFYVHFASSRLSYAGRSRP